MVRFTAGASRHHNCWTAYSAHLPDACGVQAILFSGALEVVSECMVQPVLAGALATPVPQTGYSAMDNHGCV